MKKKVTAIIVIGAISSQIISPSIIVFSNELESKGDTLDINSEKQKEYNKEGKDDEQYTDSEIIIQENQVENENIENILDDNLKKDIEDIESNRNDVINNNIPWNEEEISLFGLGQRNIATFRYDYENKRLKILNSNSSGSLVHTYFADENFLDLQIMRGDKEILSVKIKGNDTYLSANEKLKKIETLEIKPGDKLVFNSSRNEYGWFKTRGFGTMNTNRRKFIIQENNLTLETVNRNLKEEAIFLQNKNNGLMNIITFDESGKIKCTRNSDKTYGESNEEYINIKLVRNKSIIEEFIIKGSSTGENVDNKLNNIDYKNGDEIYFQSNNDKAVRSISEGYVFKYKINNNKLNPIIGSAPTISTSDITLNVGDKFNPLDGVDVFDDEDGNITNKIIIDFNNVDTNKVGVYYVEYTIIDNDGNKTSLNRVIKVKSDSNISGKIKIGTYDDFSNMSNIGLNRGNYHGRESLGFILPANTKLEVRQINSNYKDKLTLDLFNDSSSKEGRINIPNDGNWVSIENENESVPFIKKVSSSIIPEIEFRVHGETNHLPIYKESEDENNFFKEWDLSDASFAFIENNRVQMLVPKIDKSYLSKMRDFKSIDELFEFYDKMFQMYDDFLGLEKNSVNPLNRNVDTQYFVKANQNGAGAAYYSTDHTAENSYTLRSYLEKGWLPLHEIGHGYEYDIKNKGIPLVDVFNNILSHFYERTFSDGDKGWFFGSTGNRDSIDENLKTIRESGSYNSASHHGKLGVFVYLIEFIGQDKFAEFNKLYREKNSNGELNDKNIGEILRELNFESTGYDFGSYFDSYKIPNSEDRDLKEEKYLNSKNVFILGDIIKDKEKANQIKVEKNLKSVYSLISTEEIISSKVNLEKGKLDINIKNIDEVVGETIYLIDGKKVIDKIVIDKNKKVEFENVTPGRYKISFSNKNNKFDRYSDIKTIDVYSGNNKIDLKAPYSGEGVSLFNQTVKLNGLGEGTFSEITTDLKENKIKIKINSGKPHVYFSNQYAKIEIFDENKNSIYEKSFIGNEEQKPTTQILDIKPGYKIKIFHEEPSRLLVLDSDSHVYAGKVKENELTLLKNGISWNVINDNDNDRWVRIIENYANRIIKELGDDIKNYNLYRNKRVSLKQAISVLPKNIQDEMIEKYGYIFNYNIEIEASLNQSKGGMMLSTAGKGLRLFASLENVDSKEVATYYITTAGNVKETPLFEVKSTVSNGDYSQIKTSIEFSELTKLQADTNTKLYVKRLLKGQEPTYTELKTGDVDLNKAFEISDLKESINVTADDSKTINVTKTIKEGLVYDQGVKDIYWNSAGMTVKGKATVNGNTDVMDKAKVSMLLKDADGKNIQINGINVEARGMIANGEYKVIVPYDLLEKANTFELRIIGTNIQTTDILKKGSIETIASGVRQDKSYKLTAGEEGEVMLSIDKIASTTAKSQLSKAIVTTDNESGIRQFTLNGGVDIPGVDVLGSGVKYRIIGKKGNDVVLDKGVTRVKDDKGGYGKYKTNIKLSDLIGIKLEREEYISFTMNVEYAGSIYEVDLGAIEGFTAIEAKDTKTKEIFELSQKGGKVVITKM